MLFLKRKTAALIFISKPPFGIEDFYTYDYYRRCSAAKKPLPTKVLGNNFIAVFHSYFRLEDP